MRKFVIALLLAGAAATPALAGPHDPDHQQSNENHESHQQAHEERQQSRAERPQFAAPRMQAPQVQVRQQGFNGGGQHVEGQRVQGHPNFGGRMNGAGARFDGNPGAAVEDNGVRRFEGNPRVRVEQNQGSYVAPGPRMVTAPHQFERVRGQRVGNGDFRRSGRAFPVSNVPRPGTQPPLRVEGRNHHVDWNPNWRNDRRYDWRDRRRHHRSLFHFGIFIDPFGWDYQPFSIGYRMWPAYYDNQYWIDPGVYGLPYPPPGAVWIRYWNDAILIDTYSGTVIDVIPGFFY